MESPVLVIAFNRPDLLKNLLIKLKKYKPKRLYIHLDGPRENNETDTWLINQCLKELEGIDWEATTKVLKQEHNLGCKEAVLCAINWAFENEDKLIIIEDDIDFGTSFIEFCNKQLDENYHNERIIAVCGYNPFAIPWTSDRDDSNKILFSSYPLIWGWATWKYKWKMFYNSDPGMSLSKVFLIFRENNFNLITTLYFVISLILIQNKKLDTWDFQLYLSSVLNQKKVIIPMKSLTKNLGFRPDATHTKNTNSIKTKKMYSDKLSFDHNYRRQLTKNLFRLALIRMIKYFNIKR